MFVNLINSTTPQILDSSPSCLKKEQATNEDFSTTLNALLISPPKTMLKQKAFQLSLKALEAKSLQPSTTQELKAQSSKGQNTTSLEYIPTFICELSLWISSSRKKLFKAPTTCQKRRRDNQKNKG